MQITIGIALLLVSVDTGPAVALPLTNSHIYVGDGSNNAADVPMSGDSSIDNTGKVTVSNGHVTPTGGNTTRTLTDLVAEVQDVTSYGAACNLVYGSGPATLNGTTSATLADNIPASAIGQQISFVGPGATFNTTIANANGTTAVTLGSAPGFSHTSLVREGSQYCERRVWLCEGRHAYRG
jgi:hypothetical protein